MHARQTSSDDRRSKVPADVLLIGVAAVAALAAALAPAGLTGNGAVDAVERALVAGFVAFVAAHGRRWSWLVAGAVLAVPARGVALVLVLLALAVAVGGAVPKRRPRAAGAVGAGLLANVAFWYGSDAWAWAPLLAAVAFALLIGSGLPNLHTHRRRVAVGLLGGVAALALLAAVAVAVVVFQARSDLEAGTSEARQALSAARGGQPEAAEAALARARGHLDAAADRLSGPLAAPADAVPLLAQQVHAVDVAVREGTRVSSAAGDLVATADYDRLQYAGRIDLDQVRDLARPTARADAALAEAARRLRDVGDSWLLPPLRDRIDQFADELADARSDTDLAGDLLTVTPDLLGGAGPRRYLVVFLTPAELRGAGGFIGSYAELTATDGRVQLSRSGRIMDLIGAAPAGTRTISGPEDYVRRYGRFKPQDFLQDVPYSPDFPSDAAVLAELYPQSGGSPVDGVISVDPSGLAALLALTGPITVPGLDQPLTTDNAVEVLTRDQYIQVPDDAERGQILTEATRITFEVLTGSSLPGPARLGEVLSPATRAGHLRMWSPVEREQRLFERLGADGSLAIPTGADGFSVVQQNAGNNKLDAYLQRTITYRSTVDAETGALTATLEVRLANDVPSLDLPLPVVGNRRGVPLGTNLAWISVFTPHVITGATLDGVPISLGPDREQGLNVFDTPLVSIPPGGAITLEFELAGALDLANGYRLRILPQPVANPDEVSASLSVSGGTVTGPEPGGQDGPTQVVAAGPLEVPTDRRLTIDR